MKTRSIILVNKWIATHSWMQLNFGLSDMAVMQAQMAVGEVLIINTYNKITHSDMVGCILQVMMSRAQCRSDTASTRHTH